MLTLVLVIFNMNFSFDTTQYINNLKNNPEFKIASSQELLNSFESIVNKANIGILDLIVVKNNGLVDFKSSDPAVLRFDEIIKNERFNFNILHSLNYIYAENEKDAKFIEVVKFVNTRFNNSFSKFEGLLETAKVNNSSLALLTRDVISVIALSEELSLIKKYSFIKINSLDLAFKDLSEFFENYSDGKIFISCSSIEQDLIQDLKELVEMYAGLASKDLIIQELTALNKFIDENKKI